MVKRGSNSSLLYLSKFERRDIMNQEFIEALDEIEKTRGVSKEQIIDSIKAALVSSYKKNYNTGSLINVDVEFEGLDDKVKVFNLKTVVDEVVDENTEIDIENAKKYLEAPEVGDICRIEITPKNFGRIAAQTAKQIVIQKIKDAEREVIYSDYIDRENEIITGEINRIRKGNAFIDLGRLEGILPFNEQIPGEVLEVGDTKKLLILEVKKTGKGPQIILSRSHPNLVKKLFELEVPEILDGVVEIAQVSREAGSRSKIAIFSRDPEIDPLGACVGMQGNRVKTIVDELNGEKIDIILWSPDIATFIRNSLAPSDVTHVIINEDEKSSVVFVPTNQLSLAIGKEGQNARLAARLTNWKIDIKSDELYQDFIKENNLQEIEDKTDISMDSHKKDEDIDKELEYYYDYEDEDDYESDYHDEYDNDLYDVYSKYDEEIDLDLGEEFPGDIFDEDLYKKKGDE